MKEMLLQYQIGAYGYKYLTDQHSPQISPNADLRDHEHDEKHTDGTADDIEKQHSFWLSQPVQDTAQSASKKQEWTDPGQGSYIDAGQMVMKQVYSDKGTSE